MTKNDSSATPEALQFLQTLETVISDRIADPADSGYTSTLAAQGLARCAQKVGEEAVEVVIASISRQSDEQVIDETADLLYHLLVLLRVQNIPLSAIVAALQARHTPGH